MANKGTKYQGVYSVEGTTGTSYGIDYIHPLTGQRVRKILKNVTSEVGAFELRSIEIADAARGAIDKAYGLKGSVKTVLFENMIDEYLKWARDDKKSWDTDEHRAKPIKKIFKGKLMSDINPFMIEKYKMARIKAKTRTDKNKTINKSTVNKEINLGSQIFTKAIEWGKYNGENPFLKAKKFKIKRGKKPGSLTPDQVNAIMDEINHPVKKDMVEFGFNAGWRISEMRKLKWEDVDLEAGRAWIVDSKNGESVEIDLNDEAVGIIAKQDRRGENVFCHPSVPI